MATTKKLAKRSNRLQRQSKRSADAELITEHVQENQIRRTVQNAPIFGSRPVFVRPPIREIGPFESQQISKADVWFNYADQKDMLSLFMIAQRLSENSIDIGPDTTLDEIITFINHSIEFEEEEWYDCLGDSRFGNTMYTRFITFDTDEDKVVVKESFEIDGEWFWSNGAPFVFSRKDRNTVEKRISELFSVYLAKLDIAHVYFINENSFVSVDEDEIDDIDAEEYLNCANEDLKNSIRNIKKHLVSKKYQRRSKYFGSMIKKSYREIVDEISRLVTLLKDSKKKKDYQKFASMLEELYVNYNLEDSRILESSNGYGLPCFVNFFIAEDDSIGWDFLHYYEFLVRLDMENMVPSTISAQRDLYNGNKDDVKVFLLFASMIDLFNKIQTHDYRKKYASY